MFCVAFFHLCEFQLQALEFLVPGLQLLVECRFPLDMLMAQNALLLAVAARQFGSLLFGLLLRRQQLGCYFLLALHLLAQ